MLILNMIVKVVALSTFLRLYKEMEACAFHPHERSAGPKQGRGGAGRGGEYTPAPTSMREGRAPIGSPEGECMIAVSSAQDV